MTRRPRLQIRSLGLGTAQIPWKPRQSHIGGFGMGRARRIILACCGLLFSKISINRSASVKTILAKFPRTERLGLGFRDATNVDQKVSSSFVNCGTSIRFAIKHEPQGVSRYAFLTYLNRGSDCSCRVAEGRRCLPEQHK